MTKLTRLLIIGHARHGKDTVCEALVERLGFSYTSSSWFAAEKFIFDHMGGYQTVQECWDDRVNHRALWHDLIRQYNSPVLSRFAKELYSQYNIYCGLRNREEYYAILKDCRPDHIIWVDACNRLPREGKDSFQLDYLDANYYFDNNGSLEDFDLEFNLMVKSLGLDKLSVKTQPRHVAEPRTHDIGLTTLSPS